MTIYNLSPFQTRILIIAVLLFTTLIGGLGIALNGGGGGAPDAADFANLPVVNVAPVDSEINDLVDLDLIFVEPPAAGDALLALANRGQSDLSWRMVGVGRHPAGRIGPVRVGVVGVNSFRLHELLRGDSALAERFRFVDLGDDWFESSLDPFDMILVTEAGNGITPIEAEALAAYAATGRSLVMGIGGFSLPAESATRLAAIFGVTAAQSTAAEQRSSEAQTALRTQSNHPIAAGVADLTLPEGGIVSFAASGAEIVATEALENNTGENNTGENSRGYVLAHDSAGRNVILGGNLAAWYAVSPALVRNAIRWAGITWVFIEPTSGEIPAGDTQPLTAEIDVNAFISGTHTAQIFIHSNAPAQPQLRVPLSLQVTGQALATFDVDELDFETVFVGYEGVERFYIRNQGSTDLIVHSVTLDQPGFEIRPAQLTIPVFGSAQVEVIYRPEAMESVGTLLTIESNDALSPTQQLTVLAVAQPAPLIGLDEITATQTMTLANAVIQIGAPVVLDAAADTVALATTATQTATPTASPTPTETVALTETAIPTKTAIPTDRATPTRTATPTATAIPTETATSTATALPTETAAIPTATAESALVLATGTDVLLRSAPRNDAGAALTNVTRWRGVARTADSAWVLVQPIDGGALQGWVVRDELRWLGNIESLPIAEEEEN